jgi:hypothetical protein
VIAPVAEREWELMNDWFCEPVVSDSMMRIKDSDAGSRKRWCLGVLRSME